jgi:curli biogenesis system outer membrane secretion channel CsgG
MHFIMHSFLPYSKHDEQCDATENRAHARARARIYVQALQKAGMFQCYNRSKSQAMSWSRIPAACPK